MYVWDKALLAAVAVAFSITAVSGVDAAEKKLGIGRAATALEIRAWDIDIRPDGQGLPAGQGTATLGEPLYNDRCASCHGDFGEGKGRYPVLVGGDGSLTTEDPVKTVGSYWPYASTIWDYVHRAMPFGDAQSLSDNEVYSLTAYLLFMNDVIEDEDFVLDAKTLPQVEMPNRHGFIADSRPAGTSRPACMSNCKASVKIIGRARVLDVTPDKEEAAVVEPKVAAAVVAEVVVDPAQQARGKKIFAKCKACHKLADGKHAAGPSLHGVFGSKAGVADGFKRYSAAMKASDITWDDANLRQFLQAPKKFIKGTRMGFGGLKKEKQIDDLLVYLKEATGTN